MKICFVVNSFKILYRYEWGIANRLLSKENELTGTVMRYDYDRYAIGNGCYVCNRSEISNLSLQ